MTSIYINNIVWDTEAQEDLPKSIILDVEDWPSGTDEAQIEDWISDYLSDEYGFCHQGFDFEVH